MPDLTAAITAQMQAKDATARVVDRWRNGLKHQLASADGRERFALDCTIGSYHYLRDGLWHPVNTDFVDASGGYAFANDTMAGRMLVAADGSRRVYPRADDAGAYVDFGPLEYWDGAAWTRLQQTTPARATERITWAGPRFQYQLVSDADREKAIFILANDKAPNRFRWPIALTGLTWKGGVLVNSKGEPVAEHLPAYIWSNGAGVLPRACTSLLEDGYLTIIADTAGLAYPLTIDPPLDYQVGASANDAYWMGATFDAGGVYVGKGATNSVHSFWRFTGVAVPQGSIIDVAYLSLYAAGLTGTITNVHMKQYANNVDNATAPTTAAQAEALALTAGVDWDPTVWSTGTWYNLPSIVTPVGTVVARVGWVSGNAMQFPIRDDGSSTSTYAWVHDYAYAAAQAAKLHIEYSAAPTAGQSLGPHRAYYARRRAA